VGRSMFWNRFVDLHFFSSHSSMTHDSSTFFCTPFEWQLVELQTTNLLLLIVAFEGTADKWKKRKNCPEAQEEKECVIMETARGQERKRARKREEGRREAWKFVQSQKKFVQSQNTRKTERKKAHKQ